MSLRRRSDRKRATVGMRKRKCTRECTELSLQPARVGQRVARSSCNMRAQKNIHEIEPAAEAMGTWCSGITSAPHAEGPGFNPQCVQFVVSLLAVPKSAFLVAFCVSVSCVVLGWSQCAACSLVTMHQSDPGRTRTCNLWFRRPTPYPLGHLAK